MNKPEITSSGNRFWKNAEGQFHRDDGPACEWAGGDKSWYINGDPHRVDGPAVVWINDISVNRSKEWWIYGEEVSEEEFDGLGLVQEIASSFGFSISKMVLVSEMMVSLDKTMLSILDRKIDLCDPDSLGQIEEILLELDYRREE